ncbi:MAG: hypothetical protein HFI72_02100 [Peptococcaceae bacterium]|jgi:hypothetical protein|nr:hypothetical protein [Peptococcaceae bacterium]
MERSDKMKSPLLQLYEGELAPLEDYQEDIAEYRRLLKIIHLREDSFGQKLKEIDPKLKEEFERLQSEQLEEIYWQPAQSYIDGFRLGAKIMIDIYQKDYTEFAD